MYKNNSRIKEFNKLVGIFDKLTDNRKMNPH